MDIDELLQENQEVLRRLANYGDDYYTPERFAKDVNLYCVNQQEGNS